MHFGVGIWPCERAEPLSAPLEMLLLLLLLLRTARQRARPNSSSAGVVGHDDARPL